MIRKAKAFNPIHPCMDMRQMDKRNLTTYDIEKTGFNCIQMFKII
jgi:hypothetical protein